MPIVAAPLRFACDLTRRKDATLNIGTDTTDVVIWRGEPLEVQASLFNGDPTVSGNFVSDFSGISSATLTLRRYGPNGALLITKTITSFDTTTDYNSWSSGTKQQLKFDLSDLETSQTVPTDGSLPIYGVITLTLASGSAVTAGWFSGEITSDGSAAPGSPPMPVDQYYNRIQSDSRFQPLDIDLTTIAAQTNTVFGLGLLVLSDQAAAASYLNFLSGTRRVNTTAPLVGGGDLSVDRTLSIPKSTTTVDGYLAATDFTTFNAKENPLSFSTPLSRSANTISIPAATGSVNGYLTSADWTTFNSKLSGFTNQNVNVVFSGPSSGGVAAPTFRSLVASDVPTLPWTKIDKTGALLDDIVGSPTARAVSKVLWITLRPDGVAGTGTTESPFDGSTRVKLDAILLSVSGQSNIEIHLPSKGIYITRGNLVWVPGPNWRIIGGGRESTTLQFEGGTGSLMAAGNTYAIFKVPYNVNALIQVSDLTLDCNAQNITAGAPQANGEANVSIQAIIGQSTGRNLIQRVRVINQYGSWVNAVECFGVGLFGYYNGTAWQPTQDNVIEDSIFESPRGTYNNAAVIAEPNAITETKGNFIVRCVAKDYYVANDPLGVGFSTENIIGCKTYNCRMGARIEYPVRWNVFDNEFWNCEERGISAEGASSDINIARNIIEVRDDDPVRSWHVAVSPTTRNINVFNNTFLLKAGAGTSPSKLPLVIDPATGKGVSVFNNRFDSALNLVVQLPTDAFVAGNRTLTGATISQLPDAYALLAGRSGGQALNGDTASGGNLTLSSTAHTTKGKILFGTSVYDEANNRLGLGIASPTHGLHIHNGDVYIDSGDLRVSGGYNIISENTVYSPSFSASASYNLRLKTYDQPYVYITSSDAGPSQLRFGVGTATPSALIQLGAGLATAGFAPLKFTSGTGLTTPEAGAMEFDGNHLYFTISSTRYQIDQQSGGGGGGDFSSNTSTSVDGEIMLFSGVGGKTGKRATGTGVVKVASGVYSTATTTTDLAEGTNLYYTDTRVRLNRLDQLAAPTADVSMNSHKITNLLDPTAAQDAATKTYVDSVILNFDIKDPVAAATTGALPFSPTYSNGSSGVGATLTGSVGILVFDGYTPAQGDRLLIKNQASTFQNGIYTLTTVGTAIVGYVLTRATDFNQTVNIVYGDTVAVLNGTINVNQQFTMNNNNAITVGTTAITFAQTSGGSQLVAGTGISIVGNTVSINTSWTGQTAITTLGTITTGTWNGTAIANAYLVNSSMTIGGTVTSLGGSVLGNVTNDAQTKAAIVPNTVPSAGQLHVGNAGGTAFGVVSLSGSGATFSMASTGVLTVSAIPESSLSITDVTTGNVLSTAHGFAPKSVSDATKFLNSAATPAYAQVKDSDLAFTDVTTNNCSTSNHGFLRKLDNTATHYMDGTGAWSTPASGSAAQFAQTASVTIASTITETTLTGSGSGTLTLPANTLTVGKNIRITVRGFFSITGTPTITLKCKLGSVAIVTSAAFTPTTGANNGFKIPILITCRTTGASGTVFGQGGFIDFTGNSLSSFTATATATVDTTATQLIDVTWKWGTSSASNTVTCTNLVVEVF